MLKKLFTLLTIVLVESNAFAVGLELMDLRRFSFEVSQIGDLRDPYFPYADPQSDESERWKGTVATEFDLALLAYKNRGLFFDSRVAGDGSNKQFRTVSWEWNMRLQLHPKLYLFHYHLSEHVLEATSPYNFPLRNRFGVHITFYQKP